VWLLLGEALALAGVTAFLVYEDLTAPAASLVVAIGVTVFAAAGVAALLAVARALSRCRAGARGPAIVLQLMLLGIGYYMTQGGLGWLGILVIALGLLVSMLLLSPPTTRALGLG
jgi:hypothetical protein